MMDTVNYQQKGGEIYHPRKASVCCPGAVLSSFVFLSFVCFVLFGDDEIVMRVRCDEVV